MAWHRTRIAVVVCSALATVLFPSPASGSELIARDATAVRLQADAQGRALISFRSEGQSRQLLAWGAIDSRPPSQAQPQVAFKLQYGGSIGPNVCGAYGSGWKRENSFLTHKPSGGFCYGFYPHGAHPVGNGKRYRATVIGPGVTPDVMWQGPAPSAFDADRDATANAEQRTVLGSDPLCKIN